MARAPWIFLFALVFLPAAGRSTEPPIARYARVEVAATWTSIYVGTVSLKMPTLTRSPTGDYETTYAARVFPYFFSSESGRLVIHLPDGDLRKLERGEAVEFSGRAVNRQGEERLVSGKATPSDALQGKIKVRVVVSPQVELIFNTTYRFPTPTRDSD